MSPPASAPVLVAAGSADRERLRSLVSAFHDEARTPGSPQAAAAAERLLDHPGWGRIWLVVHDGLAIGYAVLSFGYSLEFGGRDGLVDELYLSPAHRGRGLGTAVMACIEREARTLGLGALHLEVMRDNARAIGVYERQGYRNRAHYHLMSKRLAASAA